MAGFHLDGKLMLRRRVVDTFLFWAWTWPTLFVWKVVAVALNNFSSGISSGVQKGCSLWRGRSLITSVLFIGAVDCSCKRVVMQARLDGKIFVGTV